MNKYDYITKQELIRLSQTMTRTEIGKYYNINPEIIGKRLKFFNITPKKYVQSIETRNLRANALKLAHKKDPTLRDRMTVKVRANAEYRKNKTYEEIFGTEKATALKETLSIAHTGLKQSAKTKAKRSKSLMGRIISKETRQKLSASRKEGFQNGTIKLSPRAGCGNGGFKEDLGHYVRSTFEHTFAKLLKENNIEYVYEPKRFELTIDGTQTGYTPDFEIDGEYYEIKNSYNVTEQNFKDKIIALKEQHDTTVTILIGPKFNITDIRKLQ